MKVCFISLLLCVSYVHTRSDWSFKFLGKKQTAPPPAQLSTVNTETMLTCSIKCTETQYCQSVSYNKKTQQCILQSTLSTDKYLIPVDEADFNFGDMDPPLPKDQRKSVCKLESPCQNNGTCVDNPGLSYSCNCGSGYTGLNCTKELTASSSQVLVMYGSVPVFEVYDIKDTSKSFVLDVSPPLEDLYGQRVAMLDDGRVLIAGGNGGLGSDKTFIFDPKLLQITEGPTMPFTLYEGGGAKLNGVIYMCSSNACGKLILDQNGEPLQWDSITAMGAVHGYSAMVACDEALYSINTNVERYDPIADNWTNVAPLNVPRKNSASAELDGKIYACAGSGPANSTVKLCERYDPETDVWEFVGSMNTNRTASGIVAFEGKLYVFAGRNKSSDGTVIGTTVSVESYDPTTDIWTEIEPLKVPQGAVSAVLLKEAIKPAKVLLIAGESTTSFEIYDINQPENSQTSDNALAAGRYDFASATFSDGKVLIIGGEPATQPTYIYDPELETLTSDGLPIIPYGRLAVAILNDVPIVCGGWVNSALDTCQKLVFYQDTQQWNWTTIASMKKTRFNFEMLVYAGKVYAIGGNPAATADTVERYDDTTNTWELVASMNDLRNFMGVAILNDKIYTCGGGDLISYKCEKYDPALDTWTNIADMTYSRQGTYMVAVYGKLYTFGGRATPYNVEMYNPGTNQWTTKTDTKTLRKYGRANLL